MGGSSIRSNYSPKHLAVASPPPPDSGGAVVRPDAGRDWHSHHTDRRCRADAPAVA
jgi:hypothetical protein